jgi:hypothetical protein
MVKSKLALIGCAALLVGQGISSLCGRSHAAAMSDADARAVRGGCYWYLTTKTGCGAVVRTAGGYLKACLYGSNCYVTLAGVAGHYTSGKCTATGTPCGTYYALRNGCG